MGCLEVSAVYDPFDPQTIAHPYDAYRRLRDDFPVYHNEHRGFWALSRFEDVLDALRDHASYSSAEGVVLDRRLQPPEPMLISLDPPRHNKMRSLVNRAFTPRRIAAMEDRIRAVARDSLEGLRPGDQVDLATTFAAPLPTVIIAEMLGVPAEDRAKFRQWSMDSNSANPDDPEAETRVLTAQLEIIQYLAAIHAQRRAKPLDDLISRLAAAEVEGEKLTDSEVVGFCFLLLVAGNETTSGLIGTTILNLFENPDQRRLLVDDPSRIAASVDEFVRFGGSVHGLTRTATRDIALHGKVIPKGAIVMMLYAAANRDEREFEDPDRFDLSRDLREHVGFGHGIHYCLGASLARLETRVAFEELLAVAPEFEVDPSGITWTKSPLTRGPATLPVRL